MRIVLDTNILISALITKGTPPDQLYQACLRNDIQLITSRAQIDELIEVLARPELRKYVDPDAANQMVTNVLLLAEILDDVPIVSRSPDPKDDPILAVAVAAEADLLVSGDKRDMLALGHVEGIAIRSAREALAILRLVASADA